MTTMDRVFTKVAVCFGVAGAAAAGYGVAFINGWFSVLLVLNAVAVVANVKLAMWRHR